MMMSQAVAKTLSNALALWERDRLAVYEGEHAKGAQALEEFAAIEDAAKFLADCAVSGTTWIVGENSNWVTMMGVNLVITRTRKDRAFRFSTYAAAARAATQYPGTKIHRTASR